MNEDELFAASLSDKKRMGDKVTMVLIRGIGDCYLEKTDVENIKIFIDAVFLKITCTGYHYALCDAGIKSVSFGNNLVDLLGTDECIVAAVQDKHRNRKSCDLSSKAGVIST